MNLFINLNRLIDDIYADSALTAVLRLRDPQFNTSVVTPDQRRALIKLLIGSAAYVAASLASKITSLTFPDESAVNPTVELTLDDSGEASQQTVEQMFSHAMVFGCLYTLSIQAADFRKADRYYDRMERFAQSILDCLNSIRHCPRITPDYY